MRFLSAVLLVIVLILIGTIGFAYSGLYDVSATATHSGVVDWLLATTSDASVERRARDIDVPDLEEDSLILAGSDDFNSMCAGCHGAPGKMPDAIGQGLNPPAPDLAEEAAEMSPAELFWVTKNGIKMTGMPAWGVTHDDDAVWPVVAFMTKLPGLDEDGYREMLAAAAGRGHHADDEANDNHNHMQSEQEPASNVHVHDDGTEHLHEEAAEPETTAEDDHSTHHHQSGDHNEN